MGLGEYIGQTAGESWHDILAVQEISLGEVSDALARAINAGRARDRIQRPSELDTCPEPVLDLIKNFPPGVSGRDNFHHQVWNDIYVAVWYILQTKSVYRDEGHIRSAYGIRVAAEDEASFGGEYPAKPVSPHMAAHNDTCIHGNIPVPPSRRRHFVHLPFHKLQPPPFGWKAEQFFGGEQLFQSAHVLPPQGGHDLAVGFYGALYILVGVDGRRVVLLAALEHAALQQAGVEPPQHGVVS